MCFNDVNYNTVNAHIKSKYSLYSIQFFALDVQEYTILANHMRKRERRRRRA